MNISNSNNTVFSLSVDDYLVPGISMGFSLWIIASNGLLLKLSKGEKYFLQCFFFCGEIIFGSGEVIENLDHFRRLLLDNWYTSYYCNTLTLPPFFGDLFSHCMICVMSLERLLAVAIPFTYRTWNHRTLTIVFVATASLLSIVWSGATYYGLDNTVKPIACLAASYRKEFNYMKFIAGCLAIFFNILIAVCLLIKMKQKATTSVFGNSDEENLFKSEVKACKVVMMVVINYCLFSVLPTGYYIMSTVQVNSSFSKISAYSSLVILFCSSNNLFLYLWKDDKIRRDFLNFMKKKNAVNNIASQQLSTGEI